LDLVVERVRELRLLLALTCRPEFGPRWSGHGHVTALSLSRLGRREGAALVARVSRKALPEAVVEQIVMKTDGVPLFVEELTRTVLESGMLADAGDRYVLAAGLPSMAIPATLRDALMARLDRVGPAKEIAQVGAVIGRDFSHDLLAALVPMPEDDLQRTLDDLVAAGLISRHGLPPEAGYAFRHALVRDVAYESLLKARRRTIHAAVARHLQQSGARTEPEYLAQHAEAGGLPVLAAESYLEAANIAASRWASAEAVSQAERGLAALSQVSEAKATELEMVELRLRELQSRMMIHVHGVAHPQTGAAYDAAHLIATRRGDVPVAARLSFGRFSFRLIRGDLRAAGDLAWQFLAAAEGRPEAHVQALARQMVGTVLLFQGDPAKARSYLTAAVDLATGLSSEASADAWIFDPLVLMQTWLALAELTLGRFSAAERAMSIALERSSGLGHQATEAFAHQHACFFEFARRRPEGAVLHAAKLGEQAAEKAGPIRAGAAQIYRAWGRAVGDRAPDALDELDRGLGRVRATGARLWTPVYLALRADLTRRVEGAEHALRDVEEALAIAASTEEDHFLAELVRRRAALLFSLARPDDAEAELHHALAIARRQGARLYELRAACDLARLWADRGERAKASDLLAPIQAGFTDGFDTLDLVDAGTLLETLG